MTHPDHRGKRAEFPMLEAKRLRAEGLTYEQVAKAIGWSLAQTNKRLRDDPGHGDSSVHYGAPRSAPRLSELEARVSRLETLIISGSHPLPINGAPLSAPNGAPHGPTKKRGFVIAVDLSDALDVYATASGLRVSDILDAALRQYLAALAGEVVHDA